MEPEHDEVNSFEHFIHSRPELCGAAMLAASYFLTWILTNLWIHYVDLIKVGDLYDEHPVPPGSLGLPYIGDTLMYVVASQSSALKSYFDWKVDKYGDIFKISLFSETTVFLDLIDGTKFLFTNDIYKAGGLSLLQAHWPRNFRLMLDAQFKVFKNCTTHAILKNHWESKFFGAEVVYQCLQATEKRAMIHIREHWPGRRDNALVSAYKVIAEYTFDVICYLCLGVKDSSLLEKLRSKFQVYVEGLSCIPIKIPGTSFFRACQAKKDLLRILILHIEQRREELAEGCAPPRQDFLCVLLTHPDETGHFCTNEEIAGYMLLILSAGQKTTARTLTQMIALVAKYPEVRETLIQEHARIASDKREGELLTRESIRSMKYSWQLLQETLRLYPTSAHVFREAAEEFKYKGFTIHKGWKLACSVAQVRSDPEIFPDAEIFDPNRFEDSNGGAPPYSHFPFGGGLHVCPGSELAKQVVLVFLHHLLKNAKWSLDNLSESFSFSSFPCPGNDIRVRVSRCKEF